MAAEPGLDADGFGTLFRDFLQRVVEAAPLQEAPFAAILRQHLRQDPTTLPIVSRGFPAHDHPNIQLALDAWLAPKARQAELVGVTGQGKRFAGLSLSDLLGAHPAVLIRPGPVDYVTLPIGRGQTLACVEFGLYLVRHGRERVALLVRGPGERMQPQAQVTVEAMALDRDLAIAALDTIQALARRHNVYRGQVLSVTPNNFGGLHVRFHDLPAVERGDIVLLPGVLDRIERHTIGFSAQAARLLAAGRQMRRGMLLHGPPGTGKTLSVMYLAGHMSGRTTLLLAGGGQFVIGPSCAMARDLAPAMVVLEDVDMVAQERQLPGAQLPLLFQLMNEMDGLADDADVIFALTTNRPDLLEPALAARPGRIDEAVEIALPDAERRRALIDLYGRGLDLRLSRMDELVERTDGVSGAFIKELLRKAALLGAEEAPGTARRRLVVEDRHLEGALAAMAAGGTTLRAALAGGDGRRRG